MNSDDFRWLRNMETKSYIIFTSFYNTFWFFCINVQERPNVWCVKYVLKEVECLLERLLAIDNYGIWLFGVIHLILILGESWILERVFPVRRRSYDKIVVLTIKQIWSSCWLTANIKLSYSPLFPFNIWEEDISFAVILGQSLTVTSTQVKNIAHSLAVWTLIARLESSLRRGNWAHNYEITVVLTTEQIQC